MGGVLGFVRELFVGDPEVKTARAVKILRDSGITCRCNGLAIPTAVKGKIYRCLHCNKQFANAFYNLASSNQQYRNLDMTYYSKAVEVLAKEPK